MMLGFGLVWLAVIVQVIGAGAQAQAFTAVVMHVQIDQVIIPSRKNDKPYSDYGFVHFKNRASAVKLVEECEASENPRRLEYPPDSGTFLQVNNAAQKHCAWY